MVSMMDSRRRRLALPGLVAVLLWLAAAFCPAQQSQPEIEQYIHASWDSLSRSMSDCKSVVDPKVTTVPVLYLPAGMRTPPAVAAMQRQCHVDVEHLPRKIVHMGDVKV